MNDLKERIEDAKRRAAPKQKKPAAQGFGFAIRLGVEMVASLIVGLMMGLGFDYLLNTKPWGLIVFLILGMSAGIFNVYRVAQGLNDTVGALSEKGAESGNKDQEK